MNKSPLTAVRHRFAVCAEHHRAFIALPDEKSRERLISIVTTGLVLIAGTGTFSMIRAIAQ